MISRLIIQKKSEWFRILPVHQFRHTNQYVLALKVCQSEALDCQRIRGQIKSLIATCKSEKLITSIC